MIAKALCCILGLLVLVYLNRTVAAGPPANLRQAGLHKKQTQRDLRVYDKAGPYYVQSNLDAKDRATVLANIRQFIWQHWSKRTLGYVVSTFYSKEGEPITYAFFIEADEKGNWRVAVEIDRLLVARGESKKRYAKTDNFEVDAVQRIDVLENGMIRTIPEDVPREPRSFKLRLVDDQGNVRFEV